MSVNKVILVGNVGKDPEVKHLENDLSLARFPLATSERFKNKQGERTERTEWHNVVVWRGLAKVVEDYVKKGSQLYIEGRIQTRKYQDRDGNDRYSTEIVADNMQMLDRKGSADNSNQGKAAPSAAQEPAPSSDYNSQPDEEDLPF
ncbi:Helix-destabilizing protein [Salinivirga cyanobacteriivorans]|uniref:Single-stranded DNA-binding protein n=1 Tax=Salinivirga cyanobacteriivorans TaxID=1307839 RepID=A0A0S2I3P2_9BACT|nr:single-stranded DNA-binding protein [Salinivirga cyanobacteriivorans]ALO16855.1 Helix-destabilizing protein [Salinivirga cyanobacteriivorans]